MKNRVIKKHDRNFRDYNAGSDPNPITQMNHDISVMVTGTPFEYTEYVRPACLPDMASFKVQPTTQCIISGWGTTNSGKHFGRQK